MVQRVRLPDGRVAEFPDEASQEQMQSAARQMAQETQQQQSTQDLPEFGALPQFGPTGEQAGTGLRIAAGMFTTPDPESRKDIIRTAIPGTEFTEDEQGNTVIELPSGQRAMLNKPGFSMQDFADFSSDVVKFLPSARFAAGGKTLLGKAMRAFTGGTTTSAAEDVAAMPQGSEQGVQPGKAALTGTLDVAGEGVGRTISAGARAIEWPLRRAFGRRTGDIFNEAGQLSRSARRVLGRAGINPDDVSPEMARQAVRASREGVPDEAVSGVAASRRFGVPLTRGEITGDFQQLAREEDLAARTDQAGEIVRQGRRRESQATVEAARNIEQEVGGERPPFRTEAEAGSELARPVMDEAELLEGQIDEAFTVARSRDAELTREGLDRLANVATTIRESDNVLVDDQLTPATTRALSQLENLSGKDINSQTLQEVDKTRQKINQLIDAAQNRQDRRGVTRIKRRFDQYLDDAFDNALFEGDEEALNALKNARGLRAEFGRRFQEQTGRTASGRRTRDRGGRVIESILEENPTDEEVVNMIFGRARVFNPENASKAIDSLRAATNNNPQVDETIKQLTLRRISQQAIDDGNFNPKRFVNAFNRVSEEAPTVLRKVFNEDELKALREFRDVARRQIKPDGVVNTSKTAQTLVRLMNRIGVAGGLQLGGLGIGSLGGMLGRSTGGLFEARAARGQAEMAINPQFFLSGRPNAALITESIAAARNEDLQEDVRGQARETTSRAVEAVTQGNQQ